VERADRRSFSVIVTFEEERHVGGSIANFAAVLYRRLTCRTPSTKQAPSAKQIKATCKSTAALSNAGTKHQPPSCTVNNLIMDVNRTAALFRWWTHSQCASHTTATEHCTTWSGERGPKQIVHTHQALQARSKPRCILSAFTSKSHSIRSDSHYVDTPHPQRGQQTLVQHHRSWLDSPVIAIQQETRAPW